MTEIPTEPSAEKSEFDFCFWARLMVAIPLFPTVGIMTASLFEGAEAQSVAVVLSVIVIVLIVRKIDRIPAMNKKISFK